MFFCWCGGVGILIKTMVIQSASQILRNSVFVDQDFPRQGETLILEKLVSYGKRHRLRDIRALHRATKVLTGELSILWNNTYYWHQLRRKIIQLRNKFRQFHRFIELPGVHCDQEYNLWIAQDYANHFPQVIIEIFKS